MQDERRYEAGKRYNTERGGELGYPLKESQDGLTLKVAYDWGPMDSYRLAEWLLNGEPLTQFTRLYWGRLTTEPERFRRDNTPTEAKGDGG